MKQQVIRKDVVIVGAGMAGLTAALYAGRMNLDTLVLENALVGGQIANAANIENFPGFLSIDGKDLMAKVQEQAEKYGAEIDEFDEIQKLELNGRWKRVLTDSNIYEAKAVILASGMQRRKLDLPENAKFEEKGVHYCELCDGYRYQNKIVAVAGGGNAALDAAEVLTRYAKKVYIIHRSDLRADAITQERVKKNNKIEIRLHTEIQKLEGDNWLKDIVVRNKDIGVTEKIQAEGLFVNIGVIPNVQLFDTQIKLTDGGRIDADEDTKTNIAGVFAAGDIRHKVVRQLTTAAADGTVAATMAEKYIKTLTD